MEPPPWTRTLTRLMALVWFSCELALWDARPQALGAIVVILMGSEGVAAVSKISRLLR